MMMITFQKAADGDGDDCDHDVDYDDDDDGDGDYLPTGRKQSTSAATVDTVHVCTIQ